jgi:hypothetical protein
MHVAYDALAEVEREWTGVVGAKALVRLRDGLAQVRTLQQQRSASIATSRPSTSNGDQAAWASLR